MKTLNEYMEMSYRMEIVEDKDEGGFVVSYPDLPGCITCGETIERAVANALDAKKIQHTEAVMYRTVSNDFGPDEKFDYDMLLFFSPAGIDSLKTNFPDFVQNENVAIGGFGQSTCKAITDAGFTLNFSAPTPSSPSMNMAIEEFIAAEIKRAKKK